MTSLATEDKNWRSITDGRLKDDGSSISSTHWRMRVVSIARTVGAAGVTGGPRRHRHRRQRAQRQHCGVEWTSYVLILQTT